jgi:putative acetyltransferase
MIVRAEKESDWAAIRRVERAAFPGPEEADLVDRLRADGDLRLSLVGVETDEIVGHLAFSVMQAPFRALGLAPVAVSPERQRTGIGAALIEAGLKQAADKGWQGVFVLGDPVYYERFSFDVASAAGFRCRYAGKHFMVRPLGDALPVLSGEVDYAPAFAALD